MTVALHMTVHKTMLCVCGQLIHTCGHLPFGSVQLALSPLHNNNNPPRLQIMLASALLMSASHQGVDQQTECLLVLLMQAIETGFT